MEYSSTRIPRAAPAFVAVAVVLLAGCGPTNQIVPLRGEDPDSLMQSGDQVEWLRKTGATRAVETFRAALQSEKYGACIRLLGPSTQAILKSRAASLETDSAAVLAHGNVEGLGLRGADDPVLALRSGGAMKLKEDRPFDPTRTSVTVVARIEGSSHPIEIPAMFTPDGWRIELVRIARTDIGK